MNNLNSIIKTCSTICILLWSAFAFAQSSNVIQYITYPAHCNEDNGIIRLIGTNLTQDYPLSWGVDLLRVSDSTFSSYTMDSDTFDIEDLKEDSYIVTVWVDYAEGCKIEFEVSITNIPPLSINIPETPSICNPNSADVTPTVAGGVPPYKFAWSNGVTTQQLSNASAGGYIVTVTDDNGCVAKDTIDIKWNIDIGGNVTDVCQSNRIIETQVSGGTGPYQYIWNNGKTTSVLDSIQSGYYGVTVIDQNGCIGMKGFLVDQPLSLEVTKNIDCNTAKGEISIYTNGGSDVEGTPLPITYIWNTGATTSEVSNLSSGTYTVTVTDYSGCHIVREVQISAPSSPLTLSLESTSSCTPASGSITSTITGGTAPYTFLWSNGATTQDVSGLSAGTYTVTVMDDNGCSAVESVEVLDKNIKAITFDDGFTQPVCNGSSTVIKIASVERFLATGNTLGTLNQYFTFFWSNGATTSFINVTKVCKPYSLWPNYCPDYHRIIEIT